MMRPGPEPGDDLTGLLPPGVDVIARAKWAGGCAACRAPVRPGEWICRTEDGHWSHLRCVQGAPDPRLLPPSGITRRPSQRRPW
jgi:hypothetical protein